MKLVNLKNLCIALCALVFSSALFADVDSSQMIAQSARSRSNSNMSTRNPNTWKPYYMKTSVAEPMMSSFYQQNVGVGLLYASGVRGNLNPQQSALGQGLSAADVLRSRNGTIQGKLSYNRTPVYEFVVGRDVWNWLKIALSYQHQGGVTMSTQPQAITVVDPTSVGTPLNPVSFSTALSFDTVQAKAYFVAPWTLVWKNVYHEPYLGVGVGPSWITATYNYATGNMYNFKQQITPNCMYTIDFGFKLRKALPSYIMSFVVGCKYNQWGRIGSIGAQSNQPANAIDVEIPGATSGVTRDSLMSPISISVMYQFAPYVGVQFNF